MSEHDTTMAENPARTMRETLEAHLPAKFIEKGHAIFADVSAGRQLDNITAQVISAKRGLENLPPTRRRGTARLNTLDSLIGWANRFKGETSVLYLDSRRAQSASGFAAEMRSGGRETSRLQQRQTETRMVSDTVNIAASVELTAIADYHAAGAPSLDRNKGADFESTARHGDHRGVYAFPVSEAWQRWNAAAGSKMSVADFGAFIEDNARDLLDPTEYLATGKTAGDPANWEVRAAEIARRLKGEFAAVDRMIDLSRNFTVSVDMKTSVRVDRQSMRANMILTEEHGDGDGKPLSLPRLFLIAIPVFELGDKFPLVCTFGYDARGPKLHFDLYDAAAAFEDAVTEAADKAAAETGLPLFHGTPEA